MQWGNPSAHSYNLLSCCRRPFTVKPAYRCSSKPLLIIKALYSKEEIELVLQQTLLFGIEGLRDRAILETLFATGIRRGELVKLNIDDIDFAAKLLRVHGKGMKERLVPISPRGCEWVAFYIGKIRPMFAFIGSGKALFLANNGKRYVPGKLSDMASQYVKLAGFDRTGACHLYRHNTASTMLDKYYIFQNCALISTVL